MRRFLLSGSLALACAPQAQAPAPSNVQASAQAQHAAVEVASPTSATTTIAACGPPRELTIDAAIDLGEHAGKRWALARTDADPALLLHLGPAGELLRTPLPRWTETFAAETPTRLRMLAVADAPVWWTVDLADPDSPRVSAPTPVAGLTKGKNLKGFASDGTRALVSEYRRGASDWEGETWLLDVPAGARIGPGAPATTWLADCANGRCWGWASPNGRAGLELFALADTGARTLAALDAGGCTGAATWHDGGRAIVAWSERAGVGLAAIDLATGTLTRGQIGVPGSECPPLEHLTFAGGHGLALGPAAAQSFVAIGPDLRAGRLEPLPPATLSRRALVGIETGLLVVDTSLARVRRDSGIDPGGKHEWLDEATFHGRHGLLVRKDGVWRLQDGGPLPHDGEVTVFGDGHDLVFLTRPGRAGLLMLAKPGDAATWLRLHGTCL